MLGPWSQLMMNSSNPSTAKLSNWKFISLEVVDRESDPQLQVRENYFIVSKERYLQFEIMLISFSSFCYLCYGSTAIIDILILSVRGPSFDVRIWRLKTSNSDGWRRYPRWNGNVHAFSSLPGAIVFYIHIEINALNYETENHATLKWVTTGLPGNEPHYCLLTSWPQRLTLMAAKLSLKVMGK